MFGLSPRFKVTRVVLRLLTRIKNPLDVSASMSAMLRRVNDLSSWFALVEMVGHRRSVGHKLVGEDQAKKLEDGLVERLKSATASELADEWNLFALSLRTLNWLEDKDKIRLAARLHEHLVDDGFVLTLLRTAVNYAHYNRTHREASFLGRTDRGVR